MNRYSIALREKPLTKETVLADGVSLFYSAVDMWRYMREKSKQWVPVRADSSCIAYRNTKGSKTVVINIALWNKTKHFIPVSTSIKIHQRKRVSF